MSSCVLSLQRHFILQSCAQLIHTWNFFKGNFKFETLRTSQEEMFGIYRTWRLKYSASRHPTFVFANLWLWHYNNETLSESVYLNVLNAVHYYWLRQIFRKSSWNIHNDFIRFAQTLSTKRTLVSNIFTF